MPRQGVAWEGPHWMTSIAYAAPAAMMSARPKVESSSAALRRIALAKEAFLWARFANVRRARSSASCRSSPRSSPQVSVSYGWYIARASFARALRYDPIKVRGGAGHIGRRTNFPLGSLVDGPSAVIEIPFGGRFAVTLWW